MCRYNNFVERINPYSDKSISTVYHIKRYEFAKNFVKGLKVLDAGCGIGYGSAILTEVAKEVIGVDVSEIAITEARKLHNKNNLSFEIMNCKSLKFPDNYFDVVVSFEVLEHIKEQNIFFLEANKVLSPQGIIILSSPNKIHTGAYNEMENPFHLKELSIRELKKIMENCFTSIQIFGMRMKGGVIYNLLRRLDILNLRHSLLAEPIKKILNKIFNRPQNSTSISMEDIIIDKTQLNQSSTLIVIAKNRKSNV